MDHLKSTKKRRINTATVPRYILVIPFLILLSIITSFSAHAQDYKKENKRFYRAHFRRQIAQYKRACDLLEKKRHQKNKKVSSRYKRGRSMAETDQSATFAKNTDTKPKPDTKPENKPQPKPAVTPKIEQISAEKLVQLHKNEDKVLAENKLPQPTSEKQEQVRKTVADKLVSKTNIYPLVLAPLYFNFAQDEFSVVDMEPFLIAAEYALQGRTILIEGHTDSYGADDYNMQLSIKRVHKIRQLMLDMGVPDERISIVGYGEEIKSNTNKTSTGRQLNRRVDFTVF